MPLFHPTRLTAALAFAFPFFAHAQSATPTSEADTVVVTASRFAEADPRIAANISVITREDLRNSPVKDLPELLKTRAGIDVRPLYGQTGIDATVDLRGFGEAAGSNTLILVDGLRMNPVDSSNISWTSIPLASVQRIEIVRGSGTVLFGDRAGGGVINIITDKSGKPGASATATIGSNDFRSLDASVSGGNERFYANLFARHAATNGFRENAQAEQNAVSGRAGVYLGRGEAFVDYAVYRDRNGLPGYLRQAQFDAGRRNARTPDDTQRRDGYRIRPGIALPIGATLTFEAEATFEQEDFHSEYVSFGSVGDRQRESWSLTPRLRWQHGLGALRSETVFGIDKYVGEIDARYSTAPSQSARQDSTSLYVQNQTDIARDWTLTIGARGQRMNQTVAQAAYPAWFTAALKDGKTRRQSAWDIGLNYRGEGWRAYGKLGTTYRFANTDELFSYDPMTGNPVFAGNLKPQHGQVIEFGSSATLGAVNLRASVYRMSMQDEIGYDAVAFANVNLDKTRRQGLETEADWRIASGLSAKLAYTYTDARFRDGANEDKRLTLVARHKGSATLTWDAGALGKYSALVNYVGERPYSGDVGNVRKSLAAYTTLDLQASWNVKPLVVSLRVLNALDKRYAPFAGYSTFINDYYYYPADGRSVFLSARYDFK